jgi:hypothetical protein
MPDRFSDASPDRPSDDDLREQAAFAAGRSPSGIGAAVTHSGYSNGEHFWEVIVSDGRQWQFIRVLGADLGPTPDLAGEDIAQGIEAFAATLPQSDRLYALLNANPLHVNRSGAVSR